MLDEQQSSLGASPASHELIHLYIACSSGSSSGISVCCCYIDEVGAKTESYQKKLSKSSKTNQPSQRGRKVLRPTRSRNCQQPITLTTDLSNKGLKKETHGTEPRHRSQEQNQGTKSLSNKSASEQAMARQPSTMMHTHQGQSLGTVPTKANWHQRTLEAIYRIPLTGQNW